MNRTYTLSTGAVFSFDVQAASEEEALRIGHEQLFHKASDGIAPEEVLDFTEVYITPVSDGLKVTDVWPQDPRAQADGIP